MMNIIQQVTDPMPTNLSYIVLPALLLLSSLLHLLQITAISVTITVAATTTITIAIITATKSLLSLLLLLLLLLLSLKLSYYYDTNHFPADN